MSRFVTGWNDTQHAIATWWDGCSSSCPTLPEYKSMMRELGMKCPHNNYNRGVVACIDHHNVHGSVGRIDREPLVELRELVPVIEIPEGNDCVYVRTGSGIVQVNIDGTAWRVQ